VSEKCKIVQLDMVGGMKNGYGVFPNW